MYRNFLKSKLHRARITQCDLNYVGSITIDPVLMAAVDLLPYEKVLVTNVTTGARFETYVIEGEPHSGIIGLNGACARLGTIGDHVIVMSFMWCQGSGITPPKVALVDEQNRIIPPVTGV